MDERIHAEVRKERMLTKTLNAPRETVFKAWTDPLQLRVWWGPRDFTAGEVVIEPRQGGAFRVNMVDADGRTFPMKGVFREFERPSRLVFTSTLIVDMGGGPPLEAVNTVTFEEKDGGTEITWRWGAVEAAPTAIVAAALVGFEQSTEDSLARLADYMTQVLERQR